MKPVFSNDLDNLKYDKIKQFDAIYLNNTVGMIFVDPEVREGLTRFVREGGGLAGQSRRKPRIMDWAEFGEMIGMKWGVHREPTEQATIRIDDPKPSANRAVRRQRSLSIRTSSSGFRSDHIPATSCVCC